MTNVLVVTDASELHGRVHDAANGACVAVPAHPMPADPRHMLSLTGSAVIPDVVIVDASRAVVEALALAARIDRELPSTAVVLVGDPVELSVDAMRAGARDVLHPGVDADELRAALARVSAAVGLRGSAPATPAAQPTLLDAPGRVLSVLSPKGGAGKTTISANLAVALAKEEAGSVVLVDLDLQFGDVATALGIDPDYTLDDVVRGTALSDPIALKSHLAQHESGLSVLCAPESPAAAERIGAEQVSALLVALSRQFRHVVVDTPPGLDGMTLAALDHTTDPLLLTTFDVPGARGLAKEMAALRELGMLTHARQVVLNFSNPGSGLSVRDVEATIQSKVDLTIPHSKAATAAMNMGEPLVLRKPRDPIARQLHKLATYYRAADQRRASGRHRAAV